MKNNKYLLLTGAGLRGAFLPFYFYDFDNDNYAEIVVCLASGK
jgi:hypothetical protein